MKANNFIEEIINRDLESGKVKEVYTRFPPEPNGYLHIGHAKSLCLNFGIKRKYNGKCNLRFDDTNPVKEDEEYVESIKEDIRWLGFEWDKLLFASDYFEEMYNCAVTLIKKGKAFVCDMSAEEISRNRGSLTEPGKESPWRNRSVEENLDLFERMKNGEFADGEKVLRAKIDMASPNINMRDPVIYRIVHARHHNTGDKWCVYPMYDLAHPLEDAIEGITHSICTLEFEDHRPLYDWVVRECGCENVPQQIEFARLNITDTVMSKRFLKRLVDEKTVEGWDDPRMPTICGIRRRGYPAAAVRDFCERIGVAKANSEVEFSYLESVVREHLNRDADRVMVVTNPLLVEITNYDGHETLEVENNPSAENKTFRQVSFSDRIYIDGSDFMVSPPPKYHRLYQGAMVRLKGAYIIRCDEAVLDDNGNVVKLRCSYLPESKSGHDGSGVKVKGVIQWVDAANCDAITLRRFKPLLGPSNGETDFMSRVDKNSVKTETAFAEKALASARVEDKFQFMRIGYFVKDKLSGPSGAVFNEIVGLKDSFNK